MKRLFILLICIAIPVVGHARFAETTVQCDKRYGKPKSVKVQGTDQVRWYVKQDFSIEIVFHAGRAAEIFYRRTNGAGLSKSELHALLNVNKGELGWRKVDQVEEWKKRHRDRDVAEGDHRELMTDLATFVLWTRLDGKAEASYDRETCVLFIADAQRLTEEREKDAERRQMPPTLEGF